jgi:hypothetical protein
LGIGTLESAFSFAWPVLFVAGWLAISAWESEQSRWAELARRFPGGPFPEGKTYHGQVTNIGGQGESGVTALVPTAVGLYLYAILPFRFHRAPVLVPWELIRHENEYRVFSSMRYSLVLSDVTTIEIRDRAWKAIADKVDQKRGMSG